jgi:hypothetical protein
LVYRNIHYNLGNGYNNLTGHFVVPVDGIYMFIASMAMHGRNYCYIVVDDTEMITAYIHEGFHGLSFMSTIHAVLHVRSGQNVWVKSNGGDHYENAGGFSGFLLSHEY